MRRFSVASMVAPAVLLAATQAWSADCQADLRARLEPALRSASLEADLKGQLKPLMAQPRFFEDPKQGAVCDQPKLDNPLYPGIPVKTCAYQHLGLSGWVMVANPGADLAAQWISKACADTADARACAVRLTVQAWCASRLIFPVAGNLVQPDPAAPDKGLNTAFLHGLPIERPRWLSEKAPVAADVQKQRFTALLSASAEFSGPVGSTAWPSGLSFPPYVQYGPKGQASAKPAAACPAIARRPGWLAASRASYNHAWRNAQNPLFDVAAKANAQGGQNAEAACR